MTIAYLIHIGIIIGIHSILAMSLQLAFGFTGLINLGHIALFAIGAYSSALITLNGIPFSVAILLSAVISGLFGMLLGFFTQRIQSDYLALATLAFSYLIHAFLLNTTSLTNGPLGLAGIPKPYIFGFSIDNNLSYLILTYAFAFFVYIVLKSLINSPFGNALQATRDNELAFQILGKNSFKIKIIAFMCSGFLAGLAGVLYAHFMTFIDPASFTIMQLIPIVCIVIMGGLGSLKGTILATTILVLISESLRFISFPVSVVGPLTQMIYALVLCIILIKKPKGFFGKVTLK